MARSDPAQPSLFEDFDHDAGLGARTEHVTANAEPPAPEKSVRGAHAERWLYPTPKGLYCAPAEAYIDPVSPVARAIITHGHADHARSGHDAVLTTAKTRDIMHVRYGQTCAGSFQTLGYHEPIKLGDVSIRLAPAGHILGSAQIILEFEATRVVVSGDYKREADPTCAPFEVVPCDVFVTEATFGLPVFKHERAIDEAGKLVASLNDQPDRFHLLGVYGLGKCQRMLALIRQHGYDAPIYLHGALVKLTELYESYGYDFGEIRPVATEKGKGPRKAQEFEGKLVLCPPSAIADKWSRRFSDYVACFASGWMRVRGRARQRGVELPLIVSDHVDWPELIRTIDETAAGEVWVTHGREDALVHHLRKSGRPARALALVGRDEEAE
ncbi:MAG: ligase-associated DNA damage response exonuclease [Pseudomonadota bacterium]